MTNFAIAIGILCVLGIVWLVLTSLIDRFRWNKLLKRRGISVDEIKSLQGTLIIDYVYALSMGFGSPVVWWNFQLNDEKIDDSSRIVDLPPKKRDYQTIAEMFPLATVIESYTLTDAMANKPIDATD